MNTREAIKHLQGVANIYADHPAHEAITHAIEHMKRWEDQNTRLKKLEALIRQKKGFYAVSVGHDEVKQAHKTGILKGLDVVHVILNEMITDAPEVM